MNPSGKSKSASGLRRVVAGIAIALFTLIIFAAALAAKGESHMQVDVSLPINAPASDVWKLFGEDFAEVSRWASGFKHSSLDRDISVGAIRTIELAPSSGLEGRITQEVTQFDPPSRSLTYEMRSGMPKPLTGIRNAWTIEEVEPGRSLIVGHATFDLAWWALPLTPVLRKKMTGSLESFAAELARELERGAHAEESASKT